MRKDRDRRSRWTLIYRYQLGYVWKSYSRKLMYRRGAPIRSNNQVSRTSGRTKRWNFPPTWCGWVQWESSSCNYEAEFRRSLSGQEKGIRRSDTYNNLTRIFSIIRAGKGWKLRTLDCGEFVVLLPGAQI